jgi:hypothetical protein
LKRTVCLPPELDRDEPVGRKQVVFTALVEDAEIAIAFCVSIEAKLRKSCYVPERPCALRFEYRPRNDAQNRSIVVISSRVPLRLSRVSVVATMLPITGRIQKDSGRTLRISSAP